jgi:hypothetical protein
MKESVGLFCLVLLVDQQSNKLFSRPFRVNSFPILPEAFRNPRAPFAIVDSIEGKVVRGRGRGCGQGPANLAVSPMSRGRRRRGLRGGCWRGVVIWIYMWQAAQGGERLVGMLASERNYCDMPEGVRRNRLAGHGRAPSERRDRNGGGDWVAAKRAWACFVWQYMESLAVGIDMR